MRRFSGLFLFSMAVTGLVAACDEKIVEPPVTQGSPETFDGKRVEESPVVIVLVVDDAATPEAAQLRAQVAENVRSGLLTVIEKRWGSCHSADPAAWHPGDIRVILARPSAPDGAALLTPLEMPSLAWITKRSTAEEVDLVASATAEALEKRLAGAGETYRPLRTAKRALELVTGARPPESDDEAALVASLPPKLLARLVIAGGRDDEDPASVEPLAPGAALNGPTISIEIVGPFNASGGSCLTSGTGTTRLEKWGDQAGVLFFNAWPCAATPKLEGLLSACCADCGVPCHDHPLPLAPDGTIACRVFVDQTNLDRCETERGHRDPDGKPELVDRNGVKLRRCEVNQLTGAALEACRTSLACPDCPSGFCATEVPELSPAQECGEGKQAWPVRFVGESLDAPGDWLHVVCNSGSTGG